jgi:hypothetical protein
MWFKTDNWPPLFKDGRKAQRSPLSGIKSTKKGIVRKLCWAPVLEKKIATKVGCNRTTNVDPKQSRVATKLLSTNTGQPSRWRSARIRVYIWCISPRMDKKFAHGFARMIWIACATILFRQRVFAVGNLMSLAHVKLSRIFSACSQLLGRFLLKLFPDAD